MMKRTLILLSFITLTLLTFGQTPQYLGTEKTRVIARNTFEVDSLFMFSHRDTNFTPFKAGAVVYKTSDKRLYHWNGIAWKKLIEREVSGATYDSASKIFTIALSDGTTVGDTLKVAGTVDTTTLATRYWSNTNFVTSILRRSDSVFYVKNGAEVFAFKDSVGSGGGSVTGDNGINVVGGVVRLGVNPLDTATNIDGANNKLTITNSRFQTDKGTNVASGNNLILPDDGNLFTVTGTTQINAIATANWQAGSEITLIFSSALTVKHNTAGTAGTAVILLSGGIDFAAQANDVIKFVYDGTSWHEAYRTSVATGVGITTASNGLNKVGTDIRLGVNPLDTATNIDGNGNKLTLDDTRFQLAQGTSVGSSNNLTLPNDGNQVIITGNNQINAITTTDWQAGSGVTLIFTGTLTVKHNTAGGAGTAPLLLGGSADIEVEPGEVIRFEYDGTNWHEVFRKSAAKGGRYKFGTGIIESSGNNVKADTNLLATKSYTNLNFVTSILRRADSVFYMKNGAEIFAFKDSLGAGGGSGEANTASNVGIGTGIFKQKSGVDLQFKSILGDNTITFTAGTNEVSAKVDTATIGTKAWSSNNFVTGISQSNDSLFYIKNGVTIFGFKYTPTLQQVVDKDSLLTNTAGVGIDVVNSGFTGIRVINNSTTGYGYSVVNNSTSGYGHYIGNTSTGKGVYLYNGSTGDGMKIDNVTGKGLWIDNTVGSTGVGLRLQSGGTGNLLEVYKGSTPALRLSITDSGFVNYAGKYWSSYTARTLVDKGYVDSVVAAGGGGGTLNNTLAAGNTATDKVMLWNYTFDTTNANFSKWIPSNYNTVYAGNGRGGAFYSGFTRINNVNASGRPNVVGSWFTYNATMGGGREFSDEASFRFAGETNFNFGSGGDDFEFHLPEIITTSGTTKRPFSMYTVKSTAATQFNYLATAGVTYQTVAGKDRFSFNASGNYAMQGQGDDSKLEIQRDSATGKKLQIQVGGSQTFFNNYGNIAQFDGPVALAMGYGGGYPLNITSNSAGTWHNIYISGGARTGDVYTLESIQQATGANIVHLQNNENASTTSTSKIHFTNGTGTANIFFTNTNSSHEWSANALNIVNDTGPMRLYANEGSSILMAGLQVYMNDVPINMSGNYIIPVAAGAPGQALRMPASGTTLEWFTPVTTSTVAAQIRDSLALFPSLTYDNTYDSLIRKKTSTENVLKSIRVSAGSNVNVTKTITDSTIDYLVSAGGGSGGDVFLAAANVFTNNNSITKSDNALTTLTITNTNVGSSAAAILSYVTDGGTAYMGRTSNAFTGLPDAFLFQDNGGGNFLFHNGTNPSATIINSGGLLLPASTYLNYGTTVGSTGYGVRDNAGVMEWKNSGGSWTTFSSGGGMTNPMTTTGDMIYSSSGSTPARIGIGTAGQVLTVSGGVPAWTTLPDLTTQHSIETVTANTIQLVGDVASPGNNKAYITNGSGTRTWGQINLDGGVTGVLPLANGGYGTVYTPSTNSVGNTNLTTVTLPNASTGWFTVEGEGVDAEGDRIVVSRKYSFKKTSGGTLTIASADEIGSTAADVDFSGYTIEVVGSSGNAVVRVVSNSTNTVYWKVVVSHHYVQFPS